MRAVLISLLVVVAQVGRADVVECVNGDRYNGKVLSMDETAVKLQSEIAGTLTIPRVRIVGISFREGPARPIAKAGTNGPALNPNKIRFDSASIDRVQNEFLATASPEANQLFQEMVRGVQSGQVNLGDIRSQAATTLKELREARKDLGDDDMAELLDAYGEMLERFINETRPSVRAPVNRPVQPQPTIR